MSETVHESAAASRYRIPAVLIVLSLIPVAAGIARVIGLAEAGPVTQENARFFADPVPAVLHIAGAIVWCLLGAFQFSPGLRRSSPGTHRRAGRVLVPMGLLAALTGLWLTWFYPTVTHDGALLLAFRLAAGGAMGLFILRGVVAIRRRDIAAHRAWMIRAYALGLGAGTQVFTHIPWFLFESIQGELARAISMGAGWAINAAVAEWILRSRGALVVPAPAVASR